MATNNCGKKLFLSLILRPLELPDTSHYCHFGPDNYPPAIHHPFTKVIGLGSYSLKALRHPQPDLGQIQLVSRSLQQHNQRLNFHQPAISSVLVRPRQIFYIQQSPHHLLSLEPDTWTKEARSDWLWLSLLQTF